VLRVRQDRDDPARELFGLVAGGAEELGQETEGVGFELYELQPDVEASNRAWGKTFDPDHLSRVSDGWNVRKKELHLQQLADFQLVVAVDTHPAQADVDRLLLASKELHACWTAVESRTNAAILSAIVLFLFGHGTRH
jgi:hypothetical protein